VSIWRLYFPTDGDVSPVSVVGIGNDFHAGQAFLFGSAFFPDLCQPASCGDTSAGVNGLGQGDACHIHAAHPQLGTHDVDVGQDVSAGGGAFKVGQVCRVGDFAVEFCLLDSVVGLLQVFAVGDSPFAAVLL
jgi:hypothetical protein